MTHDDIRNRLHRIRSRGTTTLSAALNVLHGMLIGQFMQPHRHQEFLRFSSAIGRKVPADKLVHVVLDNHASHRHSKVRARLGRQPRWIFHFAPTSAPLRAGWPSRLRRSDRPSADGRWLNAVEGFFARLPRRRL